nr:MAG TPA: hypothetical protein [Caudoviricetes sp.]
MPAKGSVSPSDGLLGPGRAAIREEVRYAVREAYRD